LTAREREPAGGWFATEQMRTEDVPSYAQGSGVLLSTTVGRAGNRLGEAAAHSGRAPAFLESLPPEPDVAAISPTEPASRAWASEEPGTGRATKRGRHAAPPPPYLERRGARFVVFSAIGGFVFLLGLGLQAVLTGSWHLLPVISYAIQAVVSVETSFLLNRWLTWRDRGIPFWRAFGRFNAQKTVTIALNLALYAGLLRLGINYLIANVVLTAVFTIVNYVAGDRLVFIPGRTQPAEPAAPARPMPVGVHPTPEVSVVIPCRGNESTIREAVQSLLCQDYPRLREITLIGSPGDSTWSALADITDPRVSIWEIETPPGMRDANFKRDAAVRMSSGDVIALVDSDIVLPHDWMSQAVAELEDSGASCVAGDMKSIHDSFWGRYTDSTWIGAKTPRIASSYTVTSANFGARGRKPPISANVLFTRELYDYCPIDPFWSHGSYEDYEWFWRVVKAGYAVRVCQDLFGWHEHRRGMRALVREYRRSSRGCAYFIRAHRDSPLAQRRLRQAKVLPLVAVVGASGAVTAALHGYGAAVAGLILGCAAVLATHQVVRSRSLESMTYPVVGLALGLVFTAGLVTNLIRSGPRAALSPVTASPTAVSQGRQPRSRPARRLLHPVMAICAVQAALSLTLVWSNTAYIDEANYLWVGRLEIAHWLHGTSWPSVYASQTFAGSPVLYPPLGALANNIGGLAGARIVSLSFMVIATVLLYLTASRLINRTGALFAAALWAFSEPAMRLAFATSAPLSIFLTALSAWLIVEAGYRHRRGEFVAAAAVTLALANITAYSGIVVDPVVIAFAFLTWLPRMGKNQASFCTAWLAGGLVLFFGVIMTFSHSWTGFISTVIHSSMFGHQSIMLVLNDTWGYSGLIAGLMLIGIAIAFGAESEPRATLLTLLGAAALIVAVAQLHDQTTSLLDEHIAYGIWFGAVTAGYACSQLIQWVPQTASKVAALLCVIALIYPAAIGWESAWERYHGWSNASSFITDFRSVAAQSQGSFYASAQQSIAEYYTPQGRDWIRWSEGLTVDPTQVPSGSWESYYANELTTGSYGVIALFYATTFSSAKLPGSILISPRGNRTYQELLGLVGDNSGEPGLPELTLALEKDPEYRLAAVGPYDTSQISGTRTYGIYAIWEKRAQ
jgi:putative flippase GtrA/glycosyltransferase involved in cell wall biosynthesis